jgi:hypothetical protein
MEKLKRRIFFWTLVLVFFIVAPAIVLHARGYRFDINRGVFVYSGTITSKTNPQAVDIKVNGETNQSKKINMINNSYNVTGLIPRDYSLEISADGFYPWTKKIDVHSGLASEFWNVVLVRNNYERTDNQAPGINKFYTSPDNQFIAYTAEMNSNLSVKILNISNKTAEYNFEIPAGWKLVSEERDENIEWSPDSAYVSVPVERKKDSAVSSIKKKGANSAINPEIEYDYFIIDIENDLSPRSLKQIAGKNNIEDARWDPKQKGYLFFLNQDSLFRIDTEDASALKLIASDVSSYDLSHLKVYYAKTPNDLIFKNDLDGNSDPVQITSDFPGGENSVIERMTIYDDSRISLIAGDDRELYIFNKGEHADYFRKLGEHIQGSHFSDDGKKMLFWDDFEISVYFIRDWKVQPVRVENETQNITRYSEPIKNVQWFKDYEHIIFSSGRWTKLIELDFRDHRNCMDLINTELEQPFVIYNNFLEKLFFTDTNNGGTNLYSINFPEPSYFLGIQLNNNQ